MSRRKRASMREGPLADLFRSTSDDPPADPPELATPRRAPAREEPRYGREDPAEAAARAGEEARRRRGRGRPAGQRGQHRDAARAAQASLLRGAAAARARSSRSSKPRATGARSPSTSRPAAASRTSR